MHAVLVIGITILSSMMGSAYQHEHTAEEHAAKAKQYEANITKIGSEYQALIASRADARDEITRDMERCSRVEVAKPPCDDIVSVAPGPTDEEQRRHAQCTRDVNAFVDETQIRQHIEVDCKQGVIRKHKIRTGLRVPVGNSGRRQPTHSYELGSRDEYGPRPNSRGSDDDRTNNQNGLRDYSDENDRRRGPDSENRGRPFNNGGRRGPDSENFGRPFNNGRRPDDFGNFGDSNI